MTLKQFAGLILVLLPFIGIFITVGLTSGWGIAAFIMVTGIVIAGITILGCYLLFD